MSKGFYLKVCAIIHISYALIKHCVLGDAYSES